MWQMPAADKAIIEALRTVHIDWMDLRRHVRAINTARPSRDMTTAF
jgi:hypothetical protein